MLVSTKGRYALRTVVDIAEHSAGERISLKSVAERQGISEKYLETISRRLVTEHILLSTRGKGGGYTLALPPDQITAGSVIRAVEGELASRPCIQEDGTNCSREANCRTCRFWTGLENTVLDYLNGTTIADLVQSGPAGDDYVI